MRSDTSGGQPRSVLGWFWDPATRGWVPPCRVPLPWVVSSSGRELSAVLCPVAWLWRGAGDGWNNRLRGGADDRRKLCPPWGPEWRKDRAERSERRVSLDTPVPSKKQGLKNLATSPFPLGGEVRLFARKSMLESSLETVFMRRGLARFGVVRPPYRASCRAGVAGAWGRETPQPASARLVTRGSGG